MCETCGCGNREGFTIHNSHDLHDHDHGDHHSPDHVHEHDSNHEHGRGHDHSHDHAHSHEHHHTGQKVVNLDIDIMAGNRTAAAMNRRFFEGRKVFCLNLVSSPGSGKTTILEKTIRELISTWKIYVIEGDQQTTLDAARIEKAGAPAVQINTGSGCHLDAHMIEHALERLDIEAGSILLVENVGNLVCPAMFDLGESKRVLVISVTEGEDKPLKYPLMFESSHLCIINKSDLLPYVDFNVDEFMKNARLVNRNLEFIAMSAKTGEGADAWYGWIRDHSRVLTGRSKS